MAYAFIGYSHKDEKVAEMLCDELEAVGVSVWYAGRDIKPGDFIRGSIADAIEQCRVCILILSKSSICSEYFSRELEYVIRLIDDERRRIDIFLLVIDAEGKSALPENAMQAPVWFDAIKPPLEDRMEEVAQRLTQTLKKERKSVS